MRLTTLAVAAIAGLLLVAVPAAAQSISRGMGLGLTLVGGAGGPPLDLIVSTPASGAYSFRKLRPVYGGKAARVRRASDNLELDIGFTGADFDTAAAATHCAATSCFVVIRYDQSGNAKDVSQATPANQPALIFNCIGALPCMRATAAAQVLQTPTAQTPVSPVSFAAVANRSAGTGTCYWPIQYPGNSLSAWGANANQWLLFAGSAVPGAAADAAWHAGVGVIAGAGSVLRIDGAETTGTTTVNTTAGSLVEFWGADTTTCNVSEVIAWNGYALTAPERAALTANQRAYFGF